MNLKKLFIFLITIVILGNCNCVYGDEVDEELTIEDIESIYLEDVTSELEKMPNINSRHAVVYDRESGKVLYGKKENERCKMASTTKIVTSLVVLENVENLEKKTRVSKRAAGTGGSRLGLKTDDEITIQDLLYGLLLCSR